MTRSQLARYPRGVTSEADLAGREARLGVPIFASPAQGLEKQLDGMVEATNGRRMPGAELVDVRDTAERGASVWSATQHGEGLAVIAALLVDIFGQAA